MSYGSAVLNRKANQKSIQTQWQFKVIRPHFLWQRLCISNGFMVVPFYFFVSFHPLHFRNWTYDAARSIKFSNFLHDIYLSLIRFGMHERSEVHATKNRKYVILRVSGAATRHQTKNIQTEKEKKTWSWKWIGKCVFLRMVDGGVRRRIKNRQPLERMSSLAFTVSSTFWTNNNKNQTGNLLLVNSQANWDEYKSHRDRSENPSHICCVKACCLTQRLLLLSTHFDLIKIDVYLIMVRQKLDSLIYFHSVHVHRRRFALAMAKYDVSIGRRWWWW